MSTLPSNNICHQDHSSHGNTNRNDANRRIDDTAASAQRQAAWWGNNLLSMLSICDYESLFRINNTATDLDDIFNLSTSHRQPSATADLLWASSSSLPSPFNRADRICEVLDRALEIVTSDTLMDEDTFTITLSFDPQ